MGECTHWNNWVRRSKLGNKYVRNQIEQIQKEQQVTDLRMKKDGSAYKMMRNVTNTDRTSKEREIRRIGENDWKQKTSNRKLWHKVCDKV